MSLNIKTNKKAYSLLFGLKVIFLYGRVDWSDTLRVSGSILGLNTRT